MRRTIRVALALALLAGPALHAASWSKIRYRGGTVQAQVSPWDYNTTLTVEPGLIMLKFTHSTAVVRIKPSQVVSLSYGQEAYRRVSEVAFSLVPNPPGLFGLLRPGKDHLIGMIWRTDDGKQGAVLLEAGNSDMLVAGMLTVATGKPVERVP